MYYMLDTADRAAIARLWKIYPLKGVTTNPSIISKEKSNPYEVFKDIKDIIGDGDLFVETLGRSADDIQGEAERIVRILGKDTIIKIPMTPEGLRAIGLLSRRGYRTCGTAVFTLSQGVLAARAGAEYVAPYVNRIDNIGCDGVDTAASISDAYSFYGLECKVVGASFKNVRQVEELLRRGVDAVTVSPDLMDKLMAIPGTMEAVEKFENDWKKLGVGDLL